MRETEVCSTHLGLEDHGIFTFNLDLDFGGYHQGVGGYALEEGPQHNGWVGTTPLLRRILEIAEVDRWEKLPGKIIRVRRRDTFVLAIGHFMKDDWLDLKAGFSLRRASRT